MRFVPFPKDPKMRPLAPADQHCLSRQNRATASGPAEAFQPRHPYPHSYAERASSKAAIFMVAKLEKVSDIAYGNTIRSPWRKAPQV